MKKPLHNYVFELFCLLSVYVSQITIVPLTFKVEVSEYESRDSGYADRLAIK